MHEVSFIILFIILGVTAIGDMALSGCWVPSYFHYGIPIFIRTYMLRGPMKIDVQDLEVEFGKSATLPLLFRKHSNEEYFFREKVLDFRLFRFSYTPIMHGHLISTGSYLKVVGRLNWFTVVFTLVFIYFIFVAGPFGKAAQNGRLTLYIMPMGLVMILLVLYGIQAYRFGKVGKYIIEKFNI